MEDKLIERIEREIHSWKADFNLENSFMSLGSMSPKEIKKSEIEKYKPLFLEFARKPLGFYTYRRDGPTDNFGESDSFWYEKSLFEIEMVECSKNPWEPNCPLNKRKIVERVYSSPTYKCPTDCTGKKAEAKMVAVKWGRPSLVKFCLDSYSSLNPKEKEDLEDNLKVIDQFNKLDISLNENLYRYDYGNQYRHPGFQFPRIAQEIRKHISKLEDSED